MDSNTNTQLGKRLSFYELFREKGYRVSIPIIQRDYAQGREKEKEIRDAFLNALYDYLDDNIPNRDLDFVYGTLNEADNGEGTEFIPLDGQQRLTTLFLLHWYLYQISRNKEMKKEFINFLRTKDGKSKFTYKTKASSTEFCDALIGKDIDFTNLEDDTLSKTIENSPWFFLSWKYDPTIQSMLTMLDAIHYRFKDKEEYFERLLNTQQPIITFLFMDLKSFNLTDDLYIKMNSRGITLTAFEKFKAKLEQHLKEQLKMEKMERKFTLVYDEKEKEVSLDEYFSHNIDKKWAYLFWNYRGSKYTFDEEIMNFNRIIFTNQYAISYKKDKDNDEKFESLLGTKAGKKGGISYNKYLELNAITQSSILYLVDAFDCLANEKGPIKNYLQGYEFYFNENFFIKKVLKHSLKGQSFKFRERLLFHAYIRFLIENKKDRTGISQWMRVISNLTKNTVIGNAEHFSRAIKSIEGLLPNSNNILEHLCQDTDIHFFSSWQIFEERIKAHLINKSDEKWKDKWKNKIEEAEKRLDFDGQIGFLFEFSEIVEYYKTNNDCNWEPQENEKYFSSFSDYADIAIAVFERKDKEDSYNIDYVWERAVLTKGDYLLAMDNSPNSKNLLSTNKKTGYYSWKRLLRLKNKKNDEKRGMVKKVFKELRDHLFDVKELKNSLEKICENDICTSSPWRYYLIHCPDLIRYCRQGFIRFENEHNIILLRGIRRNGQHSEMYTHYLWFKFFAGKEKAFEPFMPEYSFSNSKDVHPCIVLNYHCCDGKDYIIRIYYRKDDESSNPYKIVFKGKGQKTLDEYSDALTLMEKLRKLIDEMKNL